MAVPEYYPGTRVYVNLLNLRNAGKLETAEAFFSAKRDHEFYEDPDSVVVIPSVDRFSLKHLCRIHHHQFQDVYGWAGKVRTFRSRKNFLREFSLPEDIERFAESIQKDIVEDELLYAGNMQQATERLAHYMSMINIMHPFAEGNGRSQRAFIWLLAQDAGYNILWQSISKEIIHAGAIRLMRDADKGGIEHLLESIIEKS